MNMKEDELIKINDKGWMDRRMAGKCISNWIKDWIERALDGCISRNS